MTDLDTIETQAIALRDEPPVDILPVLELMEVAATIERRAKEIVRLLKQEVLTPYVAKNGPVQVSETAKFVLVLDKTYKPRDMTALIEAIVEKCGGEWLAFVDCLAANAFKHGACRKLLGDDFEKHFETIVKEDVELKQPKKNLVLIDERFSK